MKNNNQTINNFGNIMLVLGIVAVTMSLAGLAVTFYKTSQLKEQMTGQAVGYVNLSIVQEINIASNGSIEWGEGLVNTTGGYNYSILETGTGAAGNVTGGNWSASSKTQAIVISNIGNTNATITLASRWVTGAAHQLFGGSLIYENYTWKVSNKEVGTCNTPSARFGTWTDPNGSLIMCHNMGFIDGKDELYFDVRLWVPYDANVTGNKEARQDIIQITASTAT
ncbi:MAG: hypothetical protein WC867_07740 [Candidatus Pacearchaeota archaeon]|jgi:hypothetical protein